MFVFWAPILFLRNCCCHEPFFLDDKNRQGKSTEINFCAFLFESYDSAGSVAPVLVAGESKEQNTEVLQLLEGVLVYVR